MDSKTVAILALVCVAGYVAYSHSKKTPVPGALGPRPPTAAGPSANSTAATVGAIFGGLSAFAPVLAKLESSSSSSDSGADSDDDSDE